MIDAEAVKSQASIERVIGSYGVKLKKQSARELVGLCPFHREKTPSFTVTPETRLFHCFGCKASGDVFDFIQRIENISNFDKAVRKVAEIEGIQLSETAVKPQARRTIEVGEKPKHVDTYQYVDEWGELLYEVLRYEPGHNGKKKDFRQRHKAESGEMEWGLPDDIRRVLYRLPAVVMSDEVWICEGEKDVHSLEALGLVATTNSGGSAQKWLPEYSEALAGKRIILVPDNDEPGRAHAAKIEKALRGKAKSLVTLALPDGVKDVTEYIASGKSLPDLRALIEVAERAEIERDAEHRGLLSPLEVIGMYEGGINVFLDPSKREPGLKTGFHLLDHMTRGLHRGELTVLAARPAMGKTAFSCGLALHFARQQRGAVAIFSLEMSRESLLQRMVCTEARIDLRDFLAGELDTDDRQRAARALHTISELPIYLDDSTACSLKSMHGKLTRFIKERGELAVVMVDYLQLMTTKNAENRVQEVSSLSRGLKLMARELKIPFLVLSQLSRKVEERGDHRPLLSDLRESGSVEQDADNVGFIYREEVYRPDKPEVRGLADLILAKQRNGPIGTVPLVFRKHCTRFENREN